MNKLFKLLKEINFNEDSYQYFKDAYINKIIVYDNNKCFNFIICTNEIIPSEIYLTLLTKLRNKFNKIKVIDITIKQNRV